MKLPKKGGTENLSKEVGGGHQERVTADQLEEGKVAEVRRACVGAMVLLWNWRGLGVAFKLSSELRTAMDAREKGLGIWEGQWQRIEAGGQGGSWCPA